MNVKKIDIIFYNGKVLTVDQNSRVCEAVAVAGDKIAAVGSTEEILAMADPETRRVDLAGRSLIPGIIDAHLHMAVFGMNLLAIDCRSPGVSSIEEIKAKIRAAAQSAPKGAWIRGWGYDHSKLKEQRHPNRWDLDEVAPDNPVMLSRVCAHISAHNSRSLAIAGIGEHDDPPAGGAYEKIGDVVSGVMFENAHMNMMKVSSPSEEELACAMETANRQLVAEGITTVHDSGGYGAAQMSAIQSAIETGQVQVRLNMMIFSFVDNLGYVDDYLKVGVRTGFGSDRFRLGPIKIMIDGSSSGPTAATREPYASKPESRGIMSMNQEQIEDVVLRAHAQGWQVTCHAVGDRAISAMLDAIEKAQSAFPRSNARHRIEHCAMMTEGLMARVKALDIIPIPQPIFLYEFGDGYLVNYGKTRADRMFPCGDFIKNGILAAGSSDCPITFSNPFLNMHLAVNRTTQTDQLVGGDTRISRLDALRMFTWNGAYAGFEEHLKGSIEPGKLADMVVLSDDFMAVADEAIKNLQADMTLIGGQIVFERV
jgi:predicted amidohydrolase YtcJ